MKLKDGDRIRLKRFRGGPGWNSDMERYVGQEFVVGSYNCSLTMRGRVRINNEYEWSFDGVDIVPIYEQGDVLKVSNDGITWKNNYIFQSESDGLIIAKSPENKYEAFKYSEKLKEEKELPF